MNITFIITGGINGGKTHFLRDLYDFLSIMGVKVTGFISKGIFTDKGNKDFKLMDLEDNSELHLSTRSPIINYIPAGKFYFNPKAIEKGQNIVSKALDENCNVLIIDEIGPIELSGLVWHQSLIKILSDFDGILVMTVRQKLLDKVIDEFKIHEAFIEDISNTNPRKTAESIFGLIK